MATQPFHLYLIKPTRYDDDGYPLQWWRSIIPSNSLACVAGIVQDAIQRKALGGDVAIRMTTLDEIHSKISPSAIIRSARAAGERAAIFLIGVQSNQFPRAMDLARPFRAAGIPVCIGGFHVSGCLAMLDKMPPEMVDAQQLGISFFAGEAEDGRIDEVIRDAYAGTLKPVYNHLKDTPNLAGSPTPLLFDDVISKNMSHYSSFDLGRGCPFECSFCTIINVQGRKSRFRTADDLEKIIRDNRAIGVTRFFVTDDNFARNKNWEAFLDRLIELKEKENLHVRLNIQVDTLAHRLKNFCEKCVAAGVHQVFIGLENINADSLEAVKKKQNRIEDYREMFLAWKKHHVVLTVGYIVGFPNDTRESILRDIEILKNELPVDTLYLNYLTPLPGCEDHKKMVDAGQWMDPDLTKYDLNHRVTHHPHMSDAEWEDAYKRAHASFYTWEHMERVLKRMIAMGSGKKLTTVNRLLAYREAVRLENCAKLESGYLRIRRRRQRRPGLPIENPLVFYPKMWSRLTWSIANQIGTYARLRYILRRILKDPKRRDYRDSAIAAAFGDSGAVSSIVTETRTTAYATRRRELKTPRTGAAVTANAALPAPDATQQIGTASMPKAADPVAVNSAAE